MSNWNLKFVGVLLSASMLSSVAVAQDSEVVMRRPLPGVAGSGNVNPDGNEGDGGETSFSTYVATAQCGADDKFEVTCNEFYYDEDSGEDRIVPLANHGACAIQNGSDSDYLYYAGSFAQDSGQKVVPPSRVNATHGSACGDTEAVTDYYAVACRQSGNGSTYGVCYQIDASNVNGSAFISNVNYRSSGQECFLDQNDTRPEAAGIAESLGMQLATTEGTSACLGPNPDVMYLAYGSCRTTFQENSEGVMVVEKGFDLQCAMARPTPGGDNAYAISYAPVAKCQNPDNTEEERDIIAQQFAGQYRDPASIANACDGGDVTQLDDPHLEADYQPYETNILDDETHPNGRVLVVEEKFEFFCHRYDFSVFEAEDAGYGAIVFGDTRYFEQPNSRSGVSGWGWNCEDDAHNAAAAIAESYNNETDACQAILDDRPSNISCMQHFPEVEFNGRRQFVGTITTKHVKVLLPSQ